MTANAYPLHGELRYFTRHGFPVSGTLPELLDDLAEAARGLEPGESVESVQVYPSLDDGWSAVLLIQNTGGAE